MTAHAKLEADTQRLYPFVACQICRHQCAETRSRPNARNKTSVCPGRGADQGIDIARRRRCIEDRFASCEAFGHQFRWRRFGEINDYGVLGK
ncbi:hypothetical protein U879_05430 [Defluviimonas sp. 20V17]|nr:hypothetical protein U879_05430 [Defluviimonas sp. 20V17]